MSKEVVAKRIDLAEERKIITGMIVSDRFLKEVLHIYQPELMDGLHLRRIAGWCLGYFDRYGKAPGKEIQGIFASQVRRKKIEEDEEDLIREILVKLSDEWEESESFNEEYLLDQAEEYFRKRSLIALAEDIKAAAAASEWEEAEQLVREYRRVERPLSAGENPFSSEEAIWRSFMERERVLFQMPGALGHLLGPFRRGDFAALMGPEKRGKTFWLTEFAMRGVQAKCRVAFFSAGDMSFDQMTLRFHIYLAQRHSEAVYCKKILLPTIDCWWNQIDKCEFPERECDEGIILDPDNPTSLQMKSFEEAEDYRPCSICRKDKPKEWKGAAWFRERDPVEPLEWKEALTKGLLFTKRHGKKTLRLVAFPNNSISVNGIRAVLDRWEDQGFVPDIIIIDYADILAPVDGRKEYRHQQNETWQELRALADQRHCLVLTATQAAAKSYESRNLKESHFSEDKRKYGHVNKGIITLNQSAEDKRRMLMRIGRMFVREEEFDVRRKVVVLQGLPIGRPYLDSYMDF